MQKKKKPNYCSLKKKKNIPNIVVKITAIYFTNKLIHFPI